MESPVRPNRPWFGTGEVAALAGVDQTTIRRWANEGRIGDVGRTLGGRRRFPPAQVAALLAELGRPVPGYLTNPPEGNDHA